MAVDKQASFKRNNAKARRRLARVRLADKKALPDVKATARGNFKREDRYKILGAVRELNKKERDARKKREADNYDPLRPLRGKDMNRELDAATRLQFGDEERELDTATKEHDRHTGLVSSAYDQYRQALTDAQGRIQTANSGAAQATQDAVDKAYSEDKSAQEARDKAEAEKQARFGFSPQAVSEGARAVEAARSQGNQRAGEIRQQGVSDNTMMETRGATSVQAKAEALQRQSNKRTELDAKKQQLAKAKGDFRVTHRGKLREGEREWSAVQQEFGLKERELAQDARNDASSNATQRIVAKLYSDASKEKARATIRVAKLQLEKGKIDQKQYREIVNIYKGLPEKGSSPAPKNKGGSGGQGSGPGGSLAPWEKDKVDVAVRSLRSAKAKPGERKAMIDRLVKRGKIPARLARIAWDQYMKSYLPKTTPPKPSVADDGSGGQRPN